MIVHAEGNFHVTEESESRKSLIHTEASHSTDDRSSSIEHVSL